MHLSPKMLQKCIVWSGVAAFLMLVVGFAVGIFDLDFMTHKTAGILAFVFGAVHVLLIAFRNYRVKHPTKIA